MVQETKMVNISKQLDNAIVKAEFLKKDLVNLKKALEGALKNKPEGDKR
jgi:hypothetical protein